MHRTFVTHLIVLVLGLAIGLGAVALAGQPTAQRATDAQIVGAIRSSIGTSDYSGLRYALRRTIQEEERKTRSSLESLCRALAEHSYLCSGVGSY